MTTPNKPRAKSALPRGLLIAGGVVLAALALAVLKPAIDSYYYQVVTAETAAKIGAQPATEYDAIRRREDVLLLQTGVPMERVFAQLARGRQASPPLITPQPSTDVAPIKGWVGLPAFVHTANPHIVAPAVPAAPPANP